MKFKLLIANSFSLEVLNLLFGKELTCSADFNPLLNDKILDCFKLIAFADDKINVTVKIEICFEMSRKHC